MKTYKYKGKEGWSFGIALFHNLKGGDWDTQLAFFFWRWHIGIYF